MRNQYRFSKPPKALLNSRLDNIAIVPASLLPFKDSWQKVANAMPKGSILLCHAANVKQKQVLQNVRRLLSESGYTVRIMSSEGLG